MISLESLLTKIMLIYKYSLDVVISQDPERFGINESFKRKEVQMKKQPNNNNNVETRKRY